MKKTIEDYMKEFRNIVFPSKESPNSIEHMDIGYNEFFALLESYGTQREREALEWVLGTLHNVVSGATLEAEEIVKSRLATLKNQSKQ